MATIYASYANPDEAEKALGALLDHGVHPNDVSLIASQHRAGTLGTNDTVEAADAEVQGKEGLSTTTGSDAAMGATKGALAGIGIGILAALAAITIPGVGLVIGGGALATALVSAGATTAAGAIAGGVYGYLEDQGMGHEVATRYADAFSRGGSIVAVSVPSGDVDAPTVESYLSKYGALNIETIASPKIEMDREVIQNKEVIVDSPTGSSLEEAQVVGTAPETGPGPISTSIGYPASDDETVTVTQRGDFVDPVTGQVIGAVGVEPVAATPGVDVKTIIEPNESTGIDTVTRVVRTTETTVGEPVAVVPPAEPVTMTTATPLDLRDTLPVSGGLYVRPTATDPATGALLEGILIDENTRLERPVRIVGGRLAYDAPGSIEPSLVLDRNGNPIAAPIPPVNSDIAQRVSLE